jgi:hypothetical protein
MSLQVAKNALGTLEKLLSEAKDEDREASSSSFRSRSIPTSTSRVDRKETSDRLFGNSVAVRIRFRSPQANDKYNERKAYLTGTNK